MNQPQSQPTTQPETGGGTRYVKASEFQAVQLVMRGEEFRKLNGGERHAFKQAGGVVEDEALITRK